MEQLGLEEDEVKDIVDTFFEELGTQLEKMYEESTDDEKCKVRKRRVKNSPNSVFYILTLIQSINLTPNQILNLSTKSGIPNTKHIC